MTSTPNNNIRTHTFRLDTITFARLRALQRHYEREQGRTSQASVVRMAIAALANARGVYPSVTDGNQ